MEKILFPKQTEASGIYDFFLSISYSPLHLVCDGKNFVGPKIHFTQFNYYLFVSTLHTKFDEKRKRPIHEWQGMDSLDLVKFSREFMTDFIARDILWSQLTWCLKFLLHTYPLVL
jgi:hypothetical protein